MRTPTDEEIELEADKVSQVIWDHKMSSSEVSQYETRTFLTIIKSELERGPRQHTPTPRGSSEVEKAARTLLRKIWRNKMCAEEMDPAATLAFLSILAHTCEISLDYLDGTGA